MAAWPTPLRTQENLPLRLSDTIPLQGISGRLEHMSFDPKANRLFLASYGQNMVAVIGLKEKSVTYTIPGVTQPLGIQYVPVTDRLYVSSDTDGTLQFFSGNSLAPLGQFSFGTKASVIRYDEKEQRLYAGFGTGVIAVIDARANKLISTINFTGTPAGFVIDRTGGKLFINTPSENRIVVVNLRATAPVGLISLPRGVSNNFAMAIDETGRRLFIGCRRPGQLLVIDCDSADMIALLPIDDGINDLHYDGTNRRLYASCGYGAIDIIRQDSPDRYAVTATVRTASGASSSLFLPERKQLYLAVPDYANPLCEIRVYDVVP